MLVGLLQRVAGERVYAHGHLTAGELHDRRQQLQQLHGFGGSHDISRDLERRERATERAAAECEAVLHRVLRQVERRAAAEEQAAARAAGIEAKQRRREEAEARRSPVHSAVGAAAALLYALGGCNPRWWRRQP